MAFTDYTLSLNNEAVSLLTCLLAQARDTVAGVDIARLDMLEAELRIAKYNAYPYVVCKTHNDGGDADVYLAVEFSRSYAEALHLVNKLSNHEGEYKILARCDYDAQDL